MEEKKLLTLKINLRVTAKILFGVISAAVAFYAAFLIGSSGNDVKSAYETLETGKTDNESASVLPPPPFAGNPSLSAFKDGGTR